MVLPAFKKFYYKYLKNLDKIEKNRLNSKGNTCGIVVNYKTPDLIKKYLSNFRQYFSKN